VALVTFDMSRGGSGFRKLRTSAECTVTFISGFSDQTCLTPFWIQPNALKDVKGKKAF